jgi:hypothetical protein
MHKWDNFGLNWCGWQTVGSAPDEKSFHGVANVRDGCTMVPFLRPKRKFRLEWGTLLDRADVNCPRLSLFRLHQRCTGGSCDSQMLTDEFQRSDVSFDSGLFWVRDSADCFGDSTAFWTTPR